MKSLMNALFLTLLLAGATRADMDEKNPWNPSSRSAAAAPEAPAPGALTWGTFIGGNAYDACTALALDGNGNIYVTGYTLSSGWVSGGFDANQGGDYDAFVVKLTPQGQHLWSTFLGGSGMDRGVKVAVTPAGTCYVVGFTYSNGWTALGGSTTLKGREDGFLVKLTSGGQHVWSTYLGGSGIEECHGVALDSSGNCYVAGMTYSLDWFTGSNGTSNQGGGDAYVVKFTPDGQLAWGIYLGGPKLDIANAITLDRVGNICLAGNTQSWSWAAGGYDLIQGGSYDGFVAKLSPAGKPLWSTYLGGSENDYGNAIATDDAGNIYAAGLTYSADWVSGGYDTIHIPVATSANRDAFAIKLAPDGRHVWSTYLGGVGDEQGYSIAVDQAGNVFVGGQTDYYADKWMYGGSQMTSSGGKDGFVAKLSPQGKMLWASCVGGYGDDDVEALAVDGSGGLVVAGSTYSGNWLKGGFDTTYNLSNDGYVARLSDGQPIPGNGIRVVIKPDGIANSGARWQVIGTNPWNLCDEILMLPAPGIYEIQFLNVASCQKPSNITVEVKAGQITTVYADYKTFIDLSLMTPPLLTVKPGQRAATAVMATGLSPLSYQWKYNGVDIPGATGTTLAIAACRFADAGVYTCEASNPYTRAVSPPVRLVVCGGGSALAYLLGLSEDPAGLDLNADGKVNVADVLAGNKLTPPAASAGTPILKGGTVGSSPQP